MFRIKSYNQISEKGRQAFSENYTISSDEKDYDAIIVHSTPLHDEVFSKDLKAIVRVGAGVNTIPVDKCTKEGIAVFNTPGGNANAVKELTIATMICVARNVFAAENWVNSLKGEDSEPGKLVEKGKEKFRGPEIMGKTIGIIGLGAVGGRVAKACYDLGMIVKGYDPYLSHTKKEELKQYVKFYNDVNEVYEDSDFISIHIPFSKENEKFLGQNAIDKMKDGVYIINFARGQVVDNDAILNAINNNKVKGFATDFPTKAQLGNEHILATPHLGAGTPEADENCAIMASQQIKEFLENGNIINSVNFPNVSFNRAEGDRIVVLHKNKVGMLGHITDIISSNGLNIENLANKGRDDIAYTILDFNTEVKNEIKQVIEKLDDVIYVRILK